MVHPIVRIEDTENLEVNLAFPLDSSLMNLCHMTGTQPSWTPKPLLPSSPLGVDYQPKSQSGVGIEQDDDGVWCGLSLEMRTGYDLVLGISQGAEYLPMSLKEMGQFKQLREQNLEVKVWLNAIPELNPREMDSEGRIDMVNLEEPMSMDPEPKKYNQNKNQKFLSKPWCDYSAFGGITSENAIHAFKKCADKTKTASLDVNIGTPRPWRLKYPFGA